METNELEDKTLRLLIIIFIIFVFVVFGYVYQKNNRNYKSDNDVLKAYIQASIKCGNNNVKVLEKQIFPESTYNELEFDCVNK